MTRSVWTALLFCALIFAAFTSSANARPRHSSTGYLHPDCGITMPCDAPLSARRVSRSDASRQAVVGRPVARVRAGWSDTSANSFGAIGRPAQYVAGALKCAVNVGVALAERGIQGTGSALAKSYLNWGRPSGPVPSAVAVFNRGRGKGHVAIVKEVRPDGAVVVYNPSSRRGGWQEGVYHKSAIAYRVAL